LVVPRWIVGADGLHSKLRHWSGLASGELRLAPRRFGIRRHFKVCPWTEFVEVHWSDGAEAYVTPVASDVVGVAVLWSPPRSTTQPACAAWPGEDVEDRLGTFDRLLRSFPVLADRLSNIEVVSRTMAAGPLRQRARGVTCGNLALVGDAAGYVDAITGEGMALAFHQAVDLADAIAAGDLSIYPAAHRRHRRVPNLLTEAALGLARNPRLRRRALAALAEEPAFFDQILAVQSGDAELRTLVSAPLGRGLFHLVTGR
jgi:flavin-dependent dehydrogenase